MSFYDECEHGSFPAMCTVDGCGHHSDYEPTRAWMPPLVEVPAAYQSRCRCGDDIEADDPIVHDGQTWVHTECAREAVS